MDWRTPLNWRAPQIYSGRDFCNQLLRALVIVVSILAVASDTQELKAPLLIIPTDAKSSLVSLIMTFLTTIRRRRGVLFISSGWAKKMDPRFWKLFRQVEAEVVSRNKIHQTWLKPLSRALYVVGVGLSTFLKSSHELKCTYWICTSFNSGIPSLEAAFKK